MPRHQAGPAATVPGIFRRYWRYTRGDRGRLLAGGLASAAVTAAEIAVVLIFDGITGHVLARRHLAGPDPGRAGRHAAVLADLPRLHRPAEDRGGPGAAGRGPRHQQPGGEPGSTPGIRLA
jgi:hypothetical protein